MTISLASLNDPAAGFVPRPETARQFVMHVRTCDCGEKGTDADIAIQFIYADGSTSAVIPCPDQPGDDNEEDRERDGERGVTKYERPVIGSPEEIVPLGSGRFG